MKPATYLLIGKSVHPTVNTKKLLINAKIPIFLSITSSATARRKIFTSDIRNMNKENRDCIQENFQFSQHAESATAIPIIITYTQWIIQFDT